MRIEKEIEKHKQELLEFSAPPEESWKAVKKSWETKKQKNQYWVWAAAAVLVFSIGFIGFQMGRNSQPEFALASIHPELEPMELAYKTQIDSLNQSLIPLRETEGLAIKQLWEEVYALDSALAPYKKDGLAKIPEEELVRVLTDYYEKKLRLLNRIQREMNRENKNYENYIF